MSYYLPTRDDFLAVIPFVNATGAGAPAQSVRFGFKSTTTPFTNANATTVADLFIDNFKTLVDNSWTVGPVTIYQGPLPWNVWSTGTADPGTATSVNYTSPNVAWTITKRTGIAGQKYRGRSFVSAVSETDVDEGGTLNPTWRSGLQTLVDALKTNVEASALVDALTLIHTDGSTSPTTITSLYVQPKVRTTRYRLA